LEKYAFQIVGYFCISSSNGWTDQGGELKSWKFVKEFEWGESMTMGFDLGAQVEFSYNNYINRTIGKSPFQIVYGRSPKGVVDLVKFRIWRTEGVLMQVSL
jgi:hypothetical protein